MLLGMRSTLLSSFSPAALFAAGEQGVWYDPSDMTTLFQNSAGTTPVTAVEQPVGLMLDKSQGLVLGPELVTNGTFDSGTTGWTAASPGTGSTTLSVVGGELSVVNNQTGSTGYAIQAITTAAGRWYIATCTARFSVGNGASFRATTDSNGTSSGQLAIVTTTSTTNVILTIRFLATGATTYIVAIAGSTGALGGGNCFFDNISVKEIAGNHATQSIDAARPVLSARVNLLTKTEQFDDAYWGTASRVTIAANTTDTTDPLGGNTADKMTEVAVAGTHRVSANGVNAAVVGLATSAMRSSMYFKKGTRDWGWINVSDIGTNGATAWFDLANGVVGSVTTSGSGSGASSTITSVGDWYLCTLTVKPNTSAGDVFVYYGMSTGDAVTSYTGDTSKHVYIWGADLRVANDTALPVYQRVNTSTDYDTVGFPMYLRFDGSDDSMATSTITPGIDKAQVFAGLRKLADPAAMIIAETSVSADSTNPGSLVVFTNPNTYGSKFRGTTNPTSVQSAAAYPAPITNVLAAIGDIATDVNLLNLNGLIAASSSLDQGTGNFLAYPLYIGSRAGSSLRLNGRIYSLIVRFGPNLTEGLIGQTENWISGKMGGGYYPTGFDFLVDANGNQLTDASGNPLIAQALYS